MRTDSKLIHWQVIVILCFEKIDLRYTQIISEATEVAGWVSCQLSAASLFCYAEKYNTEVCLSNGFVFIKQNRPDICYFLPFPVSGVISTQNGLDEAINAIIRYHRQYSEGDLVIWGVADDMLEYCENTLNRSGLTALMPDRDWAEYIHSSENLINMKGKRFHAKRNAINQFIRNNNEFCYVPLDVFNIDEAAGFQKRLFDEICELETDDKTIHELEMENTAIMRGFQYFEQLKLSGGIICVNSKICGFGFGSAINRDNFDLTFEKALKSHNGIYQVLEREMFSNNVAFKSINREEDLGNLRLRFAKERLHPDIMLFKRSFILSADKL